MSFDLTLTFDNGPEPDATPFVLSVLADWGMRSSFFVIGEKVEKARELCIRAHADGHWIGNHTWSHAGPLGRYHDPVRERMEVLATQGAIGDLEHPNRLFRPVGGGGVIGRHLLSRTAADVLVGEQFTCVLWNSIPQDWKDPDGWVDRALEQCASQPWTLMVLHDVRSDAMRNLPGFLERASALGARFRQDYPGACVPLLRGESKEDFEAIVS